MDFGYAISNIKNGYRLARRGWNGRGIFIQLQSPYMESDMTYPYIYMDTTGLFSDNEFAIRDLAPWSASQTDMLAEDWHIIDGFDLADLPQKDGGELPVTIGNEFNSVTFDKNGITIKTTNK